MLFFINITLNTYDFFPKGRREKKDFLYPLSWSVHRNLARDGYIESTCCCTHRVHILVEMKQGQCITVSAHSAGAYTATWLVRVNVVKGGGRAPPPLPASANFTLMTECTPESSGCNSVYSVAVPINRHRKSCDVYSPAERAETTENIFS